MESQESKAVRIGGVRFFYGAALALKNINMDLDRQKVTALIGPSGCGKSTLLRCVNRMNDLIDDTRLEGVIEVHGSMISRP